MHLAILWRRHPDLNWGIKVLQTSALPPVSYTHLVHIMTELQKTLITSLLEMPETHVGPVSYTHLDVYKRQHLRYAEIFVQRIQRGRSATSPCNCDCRTGLELKRRVDLIVP